MKLDLAPNTPEWLEARKQYRTASEAAIVLGISPFTNREKFKLIKAGLAQQYYSAAMRQGHMEEQQIREWANATFAKDFKEEVWVREGYLASMDGIDDGVIVEIKTSSHTYAKLKANDPPTYYVEQVRQQLFCADAKVGYIVAFCPKTQEYAVSDAILPDPTFKDRLDAAWAAFDAMPLPEGPIDSSDNLKLKSLFDTYAGMKAKVEEIQERMESVREEIMAFKSNDRTVTCQGYEIVWKKAATKTDYRAACKDAKLDLAKYQTTGETSYMLKMAPSPFDADDE